MKTFIVLFFLLASLSGAKAQKTGDILKQQAGEGVKQGAEIATQTAADKATDKVLNAIFKKKDKTSKNNKKEQKPSSVNNTNGNEQTKNNPANNVAVNSSNGAPLQAYSKYDFIPGEKIIAYEDFSQDAIGDFPGKWNTNASGEIVTLSNLPGNWLMLSKKGIFLPEFITSLPENFTLEFDLAYSGDVPFLQTLFMSAGNGKDGKEPLNADFDYNKRSGVNLGIHPIPRDRGGEATIYTYTAGDKVVDNRVEFQNNGATKIKVSIWRQKQRMRVYLDQNKILDLPRAFADGENYNNLMFATWSEFYNGSKYLIGNIKLAAGEPGTQNKLINEGKFSTTGILFDVNSANIKPESYGALKDIANVLNQNSTVRVKIIGHTDSDGEPSRNIVLSKLRAESVKSFLQSEFQIDATRMETDGLGAANPIGDNKTSEGKAQNRRVEFVKL